MSRRDETKARTRRANMDDMLRDTGADVSSGGTKSLPPVESRKNRFPMCVVWCPLPMITWLFPPIGHVGICYSDGLITDFLGSRFIHRGSLGFGAVARYWRLDPTKVTDGAGGVHAFDTSVRKAESFFNTCEYYNLFGNNCHQYAAHAMNLAGYQGKRDWNMVHVAANVLLKGRWISPWAAVKTWGPFCVAIVACAATGAWGFVQGIFGAFLLLVVYFSSYSFGYADPARKLYQTPNKVEEYSEDEVMGTQMHQAAGGGDDEEPPLPPGRSIG